MPNPIFKRRIFFLHACFWALYFSFFLYQLSLSRFAEERSVWLLLMDALTHTLAMMSISYLNYFVFFERFLKHRRIWQYLLELALPFTIVWYGTLEMKRWLIDGYSGQIKFLYDTRFMTHMFVSTLFIVAFVAMLKFVEHWLELENQRKELEHEKLTAELRFLKAQINPHFLFNTLNNLYYLAYTKAPNTPDIIAKLSEMMRYMIYDSNHATVPLRREIDYMENYISLEKMRLNNQIPIEFSINGDVEQVYVTPLILITFLENAFKHGVSANNPNAWIKVNLSVQGKQLHYEVANSLLEGPQTLESTGIGLQNAQRRLELSYPDRFRLDSQLLDKEYRVRLQLEVA
jgi:two-component system, LytTR family, sensor histidine kinase AlgZ